MSILSNLNPEQQIAAKTIGGPVKILACAGSGKTRTISYRAAYMIENGVDPRNILMITFTNKSAKEIIDRVSSINSRAKKIIKGTFHSICVKILRSEYKEARLPARFAIFDIADQISLLREICNQQFPHQEVDVKRLQAAISDLKNKGVSLGEYMEGVDEEEPFWMIFESAFLSYEERMSFYGALDFDDLINKTVELFELKEHVRDKYSSHFKYIMVDEFQDTNKVQLKLLQQLSKNHGNICVVGDDDQSIYSFRGAVVDNIINFEDMFPGCVTIKLEKNYRSTQEILTLAEKVVSENKNRCEKSLVSSIGNGKIPEVWKFADGDREISAVVDHLMGGLVNDEVMPKDVAILCRGSKIFESIESELLLNQIPYEVFGGQKINEKKESKDMLGYLQVIMNNNNEVALRRIINTPHRGIGKKTLDKFVERAEETGASLYSVLDSYPHLAGAQEGAVRAFTGMINSKSSQVSNSTPVHHIINDIVQQVGYREYIEKSSKTPKQAAKRMGVLDTLVNMAERYSNNNGQFAKVNKFIDNLVLIKNEEEEESNKVSLMTIHSSKGLEFKRVYMPRCNEGEFPGTRSVEAGDIEEERRLFYVAVTRAQEELFISYAKEIKKWGKMIPSYPSRFISGKEELYRLVDKDSFGDFGDGFFEDLLDAM